MRLAAITTLVATALMWAPAATGATNAKAQEKCTDAREAITFYRTNAWTAQDALSEQRYRTSHAERWARGCNFLRWVADLWHKRSEQATSYVSSINGSPRRAICFVFGRYCEQAIRVSSCETGGTFHIGAQNGQYLGIFQMGNYARSRYGHGNTAIEQARAAFAYFRESGYNWSPWSCKP